MDNESTHIAIPRKNSDYIYLLRKEPTTASGDPLNDSELVMHEMHERILELTTYIDHKDAKEERLENKITKFDMAISKLIREIYYERQVNGDTDFLEKINKDLMKLTKPN